MVQSPLGYTSYEGQSLINILSDIEEWEVYTLSINSLFQNTIEELEKNGYFELIGYNFKMTILNTITTTNTFSHDLKIIKEGIKNNCIQDSDIKLLSKIGNVARDFNYSFPKDFKDDYTWHNHSNDNFLKAEELYQKGRDFFFTLMDASNAANRLEDYKRMTNNTTISINGNGHNIQTGNNSTMNIGTNNGAQEEALALLTTLLENLDSYFSEDENDKKQVAEEYIECVSEEIKKKDPKKAVLNTLLTSLKALCGSVTFVDSIVSIGTTLNLFK